MSAVKPDQLIRRVSLPDRPMPCDLEIRDGIIRRIAPSLPARDLPVFSGEGLWALPGMIDLHTHMRDPGLTRKEDFSSGSRAAAHGGVTCFLDMPNTNPVTTTPEGLKRKEDEARGRCYVHYGFHFGGSHADNSNIIPQILDRTFSVKIYLNVTTGDMLIQDQNVLERVFAASRRVAVHAEQEMVSRAVSLARKYRKPLYLCHLSRKEELRVLQEAKEEGLPVYGEVTPHHLIFTRDDQNSFLCMKPELQTEEDREALWEGIASGLIDTVGTDHAPHLPEEKKSGAVFGVPGVETALLLLLEFVREKKLTLRRLIELYSGRPAEIFGLKNKGALREGFDADIVLVRPGVKETIRADWLFSKCGWTPYEGFPVSHRVEATFVGGYLVYRPGYFDPVPRGKALL